MVCIEPTGIVLGRIMWGDMRVAQVLYELRVNKDSVAENTVAFYHNRGKPIWLQFHEISYIRQRLSSEAYGGNAKQSECRSKLAHSTRVILSLMLSAVSFYANVVDNSQALRRVMSQVSVEDICK